MTFKQLSGFIAGPGGFLLLVFFFLPWISVSCSGNTFIEASGMDLATGVDEGDIKLDFNEAMFEDFGDFGYGYGEFDPGYGYGEFDPGYGEINVGADTSGESFLDEADPKLFLIPMIGLVALGWAMVGFVQENVLNTITGIGLYIIPALIGGGIMVLKFVQIESDMNDLEAEQAAQGGFEIVALNYEAGWWISGFSLLAIFIAGAIIFLGEGETSLAPKKDKKRVTGKLAALQASQPPPKPESLSAEELKARFEEAKTHIQAKRYDEARAVLRTIKHPKAAEWLQKIDELDPFTNPFA